MTVDVLHQKKEELAGIYLEDLKKELWTLQWGVVDVLATRLKKRMTSETALSNIDDLKLTAAEKQLATLSPATAEKIFAFIQEKQEKLASATTVEELEALKEEMKTTTGEKVLETEGTPSKTEAIVWWTAAWAAALWIDVAAIKKIDALKQANKIKSIECKTSKEFAEKIQQQFNAIAEDLKKQAANPHFVGTQRMNIMESAEEFKTIAAQVDESTMNSVEMMGMLKDKLPVSALKNISAADAKLIWKLWKTFWSESIANKTESEILTALEKKWITSLNKEAISVLKSAANATEFETMVGVMEHPQGVLGFLKWMKGILAMDIIVTWINIFVLTWELSEAEAYKKINTLRGEIKKERLRVQFGTSTALLAVETILTFMAFGSSIGFLPWLVVWTVAGAVYWAVGQAIDVYYDKVEFYSQNQEEFRKQYRTEIKEAIISSAASEEWNLNMDERLTAMEKKAWYSRAQRELLPFGATLTEKDKLTTTEDARKALIRQEEYTKADYHLIQRWFASDQGEDEFKKTLSAKDLAEYGKQKTAINAVIDTRMKYIKKFMYENKTSKEHQLFISAMKNNLWIKAIEKILADSKVYHDMQQTWTDQYITGCTTVEAYKTAYEKKLKTDNTIWFTSFETMRTTDQYKFLELYYGVKNYETYVFEQSKTSESFPYKDKVDKMQKRIDFVKHYYEYKMLWVSIEDQKKMTLYSPTIDNNQIQEILTSGDLKSAILNLNALNAKDYFMSREYLDRQESNLEISDSVWQNIIYRIAVEFHGYTGDNNMTDLIAFFRKDKWEALGLYYDNKRIINNDRAIDKGINLDDFETMTADEILKERISPSNWNRAIASFIPNPLGQIWNVLGATGVRSPYWFTDNASMIDTKAEAGDMDDKMNLEYRKRIKTIITEEKWYKLPEKKRTVEQAIINYIKTNSREVGKTITYDPVTQEAIHSEDKEQGYVEIPYYLIIQAEKSGIGDLRKFIFKYKNNQITACTSKLYLTDKLDFSQTNTTIQKEYISWAKEALGKNTQKYVDYVDEAKTQFEKLITYDVDELDIPKEYLKSYREKIKDRETFKLSLLTLDSSTAKSELTSKYQEYHDYFENTYIGMLGVISKFSNKIFSSNDLDSAQYHQQVEGLAAQLKSISISDKWVLTGPTDQMTDIQKKAFYVVLGSQKIEGRTILELAKSTDKTDRNKAIRAVKQIVKSIMEGQILRFDEQGNINGIHQWESMENILSLVSGWLAARLGKNIVKTTFFDASKYTIEKETVDYDKIKIKPLTQVQEKTTVQTNEVQKIIEATKPDLIYPGRGLVTFDPEKNVLTSRGKNIKIDSKKLAIIWLSTTFATLKELIMAANLMNRFKDKYPWVKDFYFGSRFWLGVDYGIYRSENWIDTQIVDSDVIKEKFPSMLNADNDVKPEVINFINRIA